MNPDIASDIVSNIFSAMYYSIRIWQPYSELHTFIDMYVITLLADMASDILFGTSSDILYHGESLIPVKTKTMCQLVNGLISPLKSQKQFKY